MIEKQATVRKCTRARKILLGLAAFVIVAAVGMAVWMTTTCPCNRMPGLVLLGDVQQTPVTDWSFVNDIPLCQIQVYTGFIPHAVNLNCMATPEGELFLSCSGCSTKYWSRGVGRDEPGRLRLNGRVYPVVLNRVADEAVLDRAWAARVKKLQVHGGGPYNPVPAVDATRPDSWWSFQLRSASHN
jgi:hypothetical protein